MFLRACGKWPSNIAVRSYNDGKFNTYTYSELYGICEYICQNLQQLKCTKGLIGLVSERNVIIPCVIAAAHKCSTVFMFLKPTEDLKCVINNVRFRVIIVINNKDKTIDDAVRKADKIIDIFNYKIKFYVTSQQKYVNNINNDYSFIAQTSGSTGEPKHIQVPIQCIQPNINDLTKSFCITNSDIIYFSTPLTFDPSMVEILLACENGASLLIAPENADLLFDKEHSITFWQTTPSKFFQFSNKIITEKILCVGSSLKVLALGGEPLNGVMRLKELKAPGNETKIYTLYGVTEMSCWACLAELNLDKHDDDDDVPLGHCLSETEIQIQHREEDKGIGNIILVSEQRKCLVLNNVNSQSDSECNRIDTGDLGEMKNGTIYYRGRRDDTIKRFGHKVNLQFIEKNAMLHPDVIACSCIWIPKMLLLILYFSSDNIVGNTLAEFLKARLKESFLPDRIIRIKSLPMNEHGKASKESLIKLFENSKISQLNHDFKTTFLNELKTSIDSNIVYDNVKDKDFFAIGGTSLLAVTLCNKLSAQFPEASKNVLPHLLSQKNSVAKIIRIASRAESKSSTRLKKRRSLSDMNKTDSKMLKKSASCVKYSVEKSWSYDTRKCVDASPTLFEFNGKCYVTVGSHSGKLVSMDALTGKVHGLILLKSRIEASVFCHQIDQPIGIVGAYDGTIICFSLKDCSILWKTNIGSMIKSKAVFVNGYVYVAAYDGNMRCLNIDTGEIKYNLNITNYAISADLSVAKYHILIGTLAGLCACFNTKSNMIVWKYKLNSPVFASPVVYDDERYVIFAEVRGIIHCYNAQNGLRIWKFDKAKGYIFSSISLTQIDDRTWKMVFGCHDNNVYCIEVKNQAPNELWSFNTNSPVYSTPSIRNNIVVAISTKGKLFLIDLINGSVLHEYLFKGEVFSSPAVSDGNIFVGSRNDRLYALKYKILNN